MRTAVFLSVRNKSTRLPGKALCPIGGRPATAHLIDRLKLAKVPASIILTTSVDPRDEALCELADLCAIEWFRGSEEDKLERYRAAAAAHGVDAFAVVDGDDLFCSEIHLDRALALMTTTGADFVTQRALPLGAASFCVSRPAIERVCREKDERDTEVWGAYFTQSGRFDCRYVDEIDPVMARSDIRMTLDYDEDLQFFTTVIESLYLPGEPVPSFDRLMTWLTAHPEVTQLSQAAQERYESNLKKAASVKFKSPVA